MTHRTPSLAALVAAMLLGAPVVADGNQAPSLGTIPNATVDEGAFISIPLAASDPDVGDSLALSASLPGFCFPVTDNGDDTGSIDCLPEWDDEGTYVITATVTDDGVPPLSDSQGFTLTVLHVNQPPIFTATTADAIVDEGGLISIVLSFSDPDDQDTLTLSAEGLPGFCSLTDDGDETGSADCAPGFSDAGVYVINVTVTDDGVLPLSDWLSFTLTVVDLNQAPNLAALPDVAIDEGGVTSIVLWASDPDIGDTLALSAAGLPGFCSLTDQGDGSGSIDCAPGFSDAGVYGIAATVTDDGVPPLSDSENSTLEILDTGAATATLEPQGAIDAGAEWRLTSGPDTSWKSSGAVIPDLPAGSYTVRFRTAYGWQRPTNQSIEVTGGATASALGSYVEILESGAATATLEPQGAIDAGAEWRLTSGPDTSWKSSGAVILDLAAGSYTVRFRTAYGWQTPANQSIEVTDGATASALGSYVEILELGAATATLEPQAAIDAGAEWRLTSGPDTSWKSSGSVIPDLAASSYTVRFRAAYGWQRPTSQSIEVTSGATASALGSYVEIFESGAATATVEPQAAIAAGAEWRLTSGPDTSWKSSGAVILDLAAGSYTVRFRTAYGWQTPANQSIEVTDGATASALGSYVEILELGAATATLEPQRAVDAGAQWKLTSGPDTSWKSDGAVVPGLAAGSYTVRFRAAYGWQKPANQSIEVTDGATASALGSYVEILESGAATATVEPQAAIAAGAEWRLTSGPDTSWKSSGAVILDLAAGSYTVRFRTAYGWQSPADRSIEVTDGATSSALGSYVEILELGAATATLEPQGAVDAGAQWKLTSGPDTSWKSSADVIPGLAVGRYTVRFRGTYGWETPSNQSIDVTDGGTTGAVGTYVEILGRGSFTGIIEPQAAIDDGAQWRLTQGPDTTWKDSGELIPNLAAGSYTMRFRNMSGWLKPANQSIEVVDGGAASATGIYTPE